MHAPHEGRHVSAVARYCGRMSQNVDLVRLAFEAFRHGDFTPNDTLPDDFELVLAAESRMPEPTAASRLAAGCAPGSSHSSGCSSSPGSSSTPVTVWSSVSSSGAGLAEARRPWNCPPGRSQRSATGSRMSPPKSSLECSCSWIETRRWPWPEPPGSRCRSRIWSWLVVPSKPSSAKEQRRAETAWLLLLVQNDTPGLDETRKRDRGRASLLLPRDCERPPGDRRGFRKGRFCGRGGVTRDACKSFMRAIMGASGDDRSQARPEAGSRARHRHRR
jgi:hypothetical protein